MAAKAFVAVWIFLAVSCGSSVKGTLKRLYCATHKVWLLQKEFLAYEDVTISS